VSFIESAPSVAPSKNEELVPTTKEIAKGHSPKNSLLPLNRTQTTQVSIDNKEKNSRQDLILNTIRQRGELSIKDLTEVIKGCSEKTIQRELVSLVNSGTLLKTGERRWSRYSLSD
jgi:predicted HTH transcriptional regulator